MLLLIVKLVPVALTAVPVVMLLAAPATPAGAALATHVLVDPLYRSLMLVFL